MRFISHITKYQLVAVHQDVEILSSGQPRINAPGFMCEFAPHDATDLEREQARRVFQYRGTMTDPGGRALDPIDEQHRISTFDTGTIENPVLRERVEKELLTNSAFGRDYVLADAPALVAAPVANWVKLTSAQGQRTVEKCAEKAVALADELGLDVGAVVAFERQEARKESGAIIAALEGMDVSEADSAELITA